MLKTIANFTIFFVFCCTAENTLCILDNLLLCHFHNPDFEVISEELENCSNPNDIFNLQRMISASLPEKYTSCVRQLLNEGTYLLFN